MPTLPTQVQVRAAGKAQRLKALSLSDTNDLCQPNFAGFLHSATDSEAILLALRVNDLELISPQADFPGAMQCREERLGMA